MTTSFQRTLTIALALAAAALQAPAQAQTAPRIPTLRAPTDIAQAEAGRANLAPRAPLSAMPQATVTHTLNAPYGLSVDVNGNLLVANIFGGVTSTAPLGTS